VSGMDNGSNSMSQQISILGSHLSTLGAQLTQLQKEVEVLQTENMDDKERIVHLEQVTEELDRRVSLLESVCGSTQTKTEITRSLMAIGGYNDNILRSAEVLNSSCNFPLPEARYDHISVTNADGKTIVCGGKTSSGPTPTCLQFDYESKSWKEHSPLLSNRYIASTVALSRGTYVLGGDGYANSSEFLATGSSVWTQGPHIPGDGVHGSCAVKLSDTEFVILGGGEDRTQAIVFKDTNEEWREWPRLINEVHGHSCVKLGGIVLMAGGWDDSYNPTGSTIIFDIKTGSARKVASLRYPRAYAAMELYRGKPLILGGYDGIEWRSDGEMWNMDTETWEEADMHLNIGRDSLSLVTLAEEIDCD